MSLKNILSKIFSIKKSEDGSRTKFCILGIKLQIKTLDIVIKDYISATIADEIYTANQVQRLHSSVFPQFKDTNIDNSVAVIGSGPSVVCYDNELNTKNIALNDTLFMENIKFDYSFIIDPLMFHKRPNYIDLIKEMDLIKFVGKLLLPQEWQFPEIANADKHKIYRFFSSRRSNMNALEKGHVFHPNIEDYPLVDHQTVAFSALQFALYTHPKKLYLIGLDTANNGHYLGEEKVYMVKKTLHSYKEFKKFAQNHYPDVEIISVNPVGLKGLFKDVYTQKYVDEHPEILKGNVEIIKKIGTVQE